MLNLLAGLVYIAAWGLLITRLAQRKALPTRVLQLLIAAGLALHGGATFTMLHGQPGFDLSFFKVASLFFWTINLVVLVSSLRKPLLNLYALLLPLCLLAMLASQLSGHSTQNIVHLTPGIATHVILSILAYSLMTIATIQALLLAYQNNMLKHKHPRGVMGLLPPLQTMETLMFELLWAGEILLTCSILSGLIFIDDIFAQHLAHKTVFSLLSWLIYATLLWGHLRHGWRGYAAVRWALGGFVALMLAYFGSKLVLELILGIG